MLPHGDFDHMREAINLVNNFKIEKVILNCGEYNNLEQELIKVLDKKGIPYYSRIKELNIDNNKLNDKIQRILKAIKQFFRKLLQIGAEYIKDYAETEVKQYYDNKDFKMLDVKDIAKWTLREEELFDYANVTDQYRIIKTSLYEDEYEDGYDDYEEYDDEIDKDGDMGMSLQINWIFCKYILKK